MPSSGLCRVRGTSRDRAGVARLDDLRRERSAALLAALAAAAEVSAGREDELVELQGNQLGDAKAGLHGEKQEHVIATTDPRALVRRREQGLDLRAREEGHDVPVEALLRDREDAADQVCVTRLARGCIVEEGPDGGEPSIS